MIEVPIFLIVAACLVTAIGWAGFAIEIDKRRTAARKANSFGVERQVVKKKLVSDHKHGLASVRGDSASNWTWVCECGRQGTLTNWEAPKPNEENAIKAWIKHVEVHERLVLPTNELSHQACDARFVSLWTLFENWRKACYCQSTSNDLILLNQEAKKFEQKAVSADEEKVRAQES